MVHRTTNWWFVYRPLYTVWRWTPVEWVLKLVFYVIDLETVDWWRRTLHEKSSHPHLSVSIKEFVLPGSNLRSQNLESRSTQGSSLCISPACDTGLILQLVIEKLRRYSFATTFKFNRSSFSTFLLVRHYFCFQTLSVSWVVCHPDLGDLGPDWSL